MSWPTAPLMSPRTEEVDVEVVQQGADLEAEEEDVKDVDKGVLS